MYRSSALFFLLAFSIGVVLFKVKYEVIDVEKHLSLTLQQIEREKENIHILKAEWSHLNEPQRLQKLAKKYLDILPMKAEQIATLTDDLKEKGNLKEFFSRAHLASMRGAE